MKLVLIAEITSNPYFKIKEEDLNLLKKLMALDGYSFKEAAKLLKVSPGHIKNMYYGKVPITKAILERIKIALGEDLNTEIDPLVNHEPLESLKVNPEYLEEEIERKELISHLKDRLNILNEKEKRIIELHYFEDKTLEEIGKTFEPVLPRERVRIIEERAFMKIRERWGKKWPRGVTV